MSKNSHNYTGRLPSHRFFVRAECVADGKVLIEGQDARQICSVLRLGCGDKIAALDGTGCAFIIEIAEATTSGVVGNIVETCSLNTEPGINLTVAQSLPKGDKLEFVIQKGTELGVAKFEVITTARTISRPSDDRVDRRLARWQAIAKEAAEQSCRAVVPSVSGITPVGEFVRALDGFDLAICLWEGENEATLRDVLSKNRSATDILLIIGPEGGIDEEEIGMMRDRGVRVASLGRRVLRCETAAVAAAAIVLYELDL